MPTGQSTCTHRRVLPVGTLHHSHRCRRHFVKFAPLRVKRFVPPTTGSSLLSVKIGFDPVHPWRPVWSCFPFWTIPNCAMCFGITPFTVAVRPSPTTIVGCVPTRIILYPFLSGQRPSLMTCSLVEPSLPVEQSSRRQPCCLIPMSSVSNYRQPRRTIVDVPKED